MVDGKIFITVSLGLMEKRQKPNEEVDSKECWLRGTERKLWK